ncbi:MAG: hypothetical protein ABIJ16_13295, partial [Bacteroidota bacterium]
MRKTSILFCLLVIILASCDNIEQNVNNEFLAKAYDRYLSKSDLYMMIPDCTSPADSAVIAQKMIESWVTRQLLSEKAAENIDDEQNEIDQLVESYRSALLIYRYQQKYIRQKLDTVVTEDQLLEEYPSFAPDFLLEHNAIKALYIKIPNSAPNLWRVRNWYRSDDEDNINKLNLYCSQNADVYTDFDNDWIDFNRILSEIPYKMNDQAAFLRYNKSLETRDSTFTYFLNIEDYKLK